MLKKQNKYMRNNINVKCVSVRLVLAITLVLIPALSVLMARNYCPYQGAECIGAGDFCGEMGYRCIALHPSQGAANSCPLPDTGVYSTGTVNCGQKYQRPATFDPKKAGAAKSDCYKPNGLCGGESRAICG